ncbi:antibiotic biosynthesis monooxygenase family protein [Spirulina sp. 06S082]|uniref:antibiotic biosynthesis monooxygenase family protein n=1 Tax=Spirulina sp. 06S082 TaxID=3110248 RepID=UPI002B21E9E0|nr:antibiotic biosynthesis monooxygenase family protein [Spirulina sp. 06S082]MEA5471173.1 antibiotic biosynthesis monooxygenase family protein [Spirulina sp. 06S082]
MTMITFVNVFTVKPGQQQTAFERIQQVYLEVVKVQPGFIDAVLLKSDDETKVTAIAHWEKSEQVAALLQQPRFQELHNEEFYRAVAKIEPNFYSTAIAVTA